MLTLNGLRSATGDSGETARAAADLTWRTRRVDALPPEPGAGDPIAIVRGEPTQSGVATDHIFGYADRVRCRFRIAADGAEIDCLALPEVSERDLFSLFAEPVMRTILVRRGLLSFHAAALAKKGRAILIMADKGAGKSTLSWALQQQGWQLLADDLARVEAVDGRWSTYPGHRQTKLTPEAAQAFGHVPQEMPPRFDDPGSPAYAAQFDKRLIETGDAPENPLAAVPLAALLFPTARDPAAETHRWTPLPPAAAVRQLLEHATPDPLGGALFVPPAVQRAIGGLPTQVQAVSLTLPDRFDRLAQAAAALDAQIAGDTAWA